jgi:hypothetical protein
MDEIQERALEGIRAKVARAKTHLDSLFAEMTLFTDSDPFALGTGRPNASRTEWTYPLRLRRPIPIDWGVVLGEVAHDLRSALDHAIYQLSLDFSGKEVERSGFPISGKTSSWEIRGAKATKDNPEGFAPTCARYQLRGVSPNVVDYVKRVQPFSSADPKTSPLLALQELWNQDKHRLLHFWGIQITKEGAELKVANSSKAYSVKYPGHVLHNGEDALTIKFGGPTDDPQITGRIALSVAFENPANPDPGVSDPLWRLHDTAASVVFTLLSSIGHQADPIM